MLAVLLDCALLATRSRAVGITTATLLAAAPAVLLPVWLWSQRRPADPIVPLSLFSRPGFAANAWLATRTGMTLFAAVVFLPVLMQTVHHLWPTESAWHLLPLMAGLMPLGVGLGLALPVLTVVSQRAAPPAWPCWASTWHAMHPAASSPRW